MTRKGRCRRASLQAVLGPLAVFLAVALPALAERLPGSAPSTAYLSVDGERLTYDEVERRLSEPWLPIRWCKASIRSERSMSLHLTLRGGLEAKLRIVSRLQDSRRNHDPKYDVAVYEVSRLLFPAGGIIKPTLLRRFTVENLTERLDREAASRVEREAEDGAVWGVISMEGGGATRAEASRLFGSHSLPTAAASNEELPPHFLRQLGDMNVLAILVHNGDVHGRNWEIREEDGACYIVDNELTFDFDGALYYQRRWRQPCDVMAATLSASTLERVQKLADDPGIVDRRLANLQGTRFGLSPEARAVVWESARELLSCLAKAPPLSLAAEELEERVRRCELAPYRVREHDDQPLVIVTDW